MVAVEAAVVQAGFQVEVVQPGAVVVQAGVHVQQMQATQQLLLQMTELGRHVPEEFNSQGLVLVVWTDHPLVQAAPQIVKMLCGEVMEFGCRT